MSVPSFIVFYVTFIVMHLNVAQLSRFNKWTKKTYVYLKLHRQRIFAAMRAHVLQISTLIKKINSFITPDGFMLYIKYKYNIAPK